jgi:hypothetical protein
VVGEPEEGSGSIIGPLANLFIILGPSALDLTSSALMSLLSRKLCHIHHFHSLLSLEVPSDYF